MVGKVQKSKSSRQLLHQQKIDQNAPGTILRDFQSLLDFIGPEGLRTTSKFYTLPIGGLAELDERMTKPLRPDLLRPQLRSFPNLLGLHLLLRSTGLGVPGSGKTTGRLTLNHKLLASWQELNPTEKYFNLLEAWLCHASFNLIEVQGDPCFRTVAWVSRFLHKTPRRKAVSDSNMLRGFRSEADCGGLNVAWTKTLVSRICFSSGGIGRRLGMG